MILRSQVLIGLLFISSGCTVFFCAASYAQVTSASLRGRVTDSSGGVLPRATVAAKNVETGLVRTTVTDGSGDYLISGLQTGTYEISAELTGFKQFVQSGITFSIGQQVVIPIQLEVGGVTEQIVVTAEAQLVNTTSASVSGLVEGATIQDLPLNGRSFEQLAILNPGVTRYYLGGQNVQNGPGVKMSISGARPESTYYMLDGTNILDHSNFTPGSAAGNNLGVDAIREFRVFTHNYSAELGIRAGGAVSIVTRSGGNELHGSVFEFHRNDNFDARNFFDPAAPPEFKRNQFGFSLGGPIIHDKTFFFGNAEWLRERLGTTLSSVVPTAEARRGILPNLSAPIQVNPVVLPYLELYPLPNGRDFGDGTGRHSAPFSRPTNESYVVSRVDHQLSPNDSFFGRFSFDDTRLTTPSADLPRFVRYFQSRSQFYTLQETHIFGPNAINEFRFAFNRTSPGEDAAAVPEADPSLKFTDFAREVGEINFSPGRGPTEGSAVSPIGVGGNVPRIFRQNIFQISNGVTHRVGRHALRYGVDVQRIQLNGLLNEDRNGAFSFIGLVNFLQGNAATLRAQGPDTDFIRGFRQTLFGSYIQNDFQAAPNLMLNLGLRYEFATVPTEVNGKISNLVSGLDPAPKIGFWLAENNSLKNFEPRLGFAWDPWGNGKLAVSGGTGIFHSEMMGRNYYTYALRQSPWGEFLVLANPIFPHPFVSGVPRTGGLRQNDRVDPYIKTPTQYHYNLTVRSQVGKDFAFEIGYVGSRGVHLLRNFEGNTAIPTILPDGRPFYPANATARNPNFSSIFVLNADSQSVYNSLQTQLVKRLSHGLRFQATYTYARSIDDASNLQRGQGQNNPSFTQYPDDRRADRGLSAFHVAHSFSSNFTYTFPGNPGMKGVFSALLNDWELGGIISLNSGLPFTAETGFNRSRDRAATIADRPNLKPGASNNPVLGGPDRYFDPTVFQLPDAGFYGNAGRNTIIGPGLETFDLSAAKQFHLGGEQPRLTFRFEMFNVFNRANFGLPRNRIFNAQGQIPGSVGLISGTVTSARQIQLGLKLSF